LLWRCPLNSALPWQQSLRSSLATAGTSGGSASRIRSDSPPFADVKDSTLSRVAFGLFCVFVFAIPWENALLFPEIGTISRLLGLVAFPVAVLAILESGQLRWPSVPFVLMSLFVAWGSLSYLWTADAEASNTLIPLWLQNLGMVGLIWELAVRRARQLLLMQAYVFGTFVSAADTLFSYLRGQEVNYQRYAGSGFDPNDLGLVLALSLPISFYLATVQRRSRVVWVYRLQQLLAISAIGLTSSRAAFISAAVALIYVPLASLNMAFREKCAFLLLGVITVGCALTLLPASSWQRLRGTGTELEEGTWDARKPIWSAGLEVFQDHPIRGVGAGAFDAATQRALVKEEVAHNTFLSILVEEGLLGFGLFLLFLLSLVLPALQLPNLERNLWLIMLATWAIGAFTLTWENRKPTWFFFGLIATWSATRTLSQTRCGSHPGFASRMTSI
jgi:O-antigen ligase